MDTKDSLSIFAALAQETRLEVFRFLIECGPEGRAAGTIAEQFDIPQNTMSNHLAILSRAGLLDANRHGRSIIYTARLSTLHGLIEYLTEDCCGGQPEKCDPALGALFDTLNQNFQKKNIAHE